MKGMNSHPEFLKRFIEEDIYRIDESGQATAGHQEDSEAKNKGIAAEKRPAYMGGNKKQVAVIVDNPSARHIDETDQSFLLKVLGALQLALDDVAIINMSRETALSAKVIAALPCTRCILFAPHTTLVKATPYHPIEAEGVTFIKSTSLENLRNDVLEKKKLWVALKNVFADHLI